MRRRKYSLLSFAAVAAGVIALFLIVGGAEKGTAKVASAGWITPVGAGLVAPACGSSSLNGGPTCVNGSPSVTISWAPEVNSVCHDSGAYGYAFLLINGSVVTNALPTTGSYTWNGGIGGTTYTYDVTCYDTLGRRDDLSTGSFTAPSFCSPAPTASISASPTSVTSGGRSTLTWDSTNATSCTAPSGNWSNSGSTFTPPSGVTSVTYLVVAGGGGGAGGRQDYAVPGGGGGAGGMLTGSLPVSVGTPYAVVPGAGGAGGHDAGSGSGQSGDGGFNSIFSTITARGGGGGGSVLSGINHGGNGGSSIVGGSGGSGGGGTSSGAGGAASPPGQGNAGGTGWNGGSVDQRSGAGGGGAGGVGANSTNSAGGNGGTGSVSSISGASVTYAGGGGGTTGAASGSVGSGGAGGGGAGSRNAAGGAGTPNTGGGGGGASAINPSVTAYDGGAGGSGIVVIRYTAGSCGTGGIITQSGGDCIHTFTTGGLSGEGLTDPLTANTTFTFQCTGPGGTSPLASATVVVGLLNGSCAPTHYNCTAGTSVSSDTWNPSDLGSGSSLSGSNLTVTKTGATGWTGLTRATAGISSGKWYWEVKGNAGTYIFAGISKEQLATSYLGIDANGWGWYIKNADGNEGKVMHNNSLVAYSTGGPLGTVWGFALDMQAGTLTGYKNGVSQGIMISGLTGTIYPAIDFYDSGSSITANFGATPFSYAPPAGFAGFGEGSDSWNWQCAGVNGGTTASCSEVEVKLPTATLVANPNTIDAGQSSNLTWSSTNATSCTSVGGFSTSGATANAVGVAVAPPTTALYQIYCDGAGGTTYSNIVTVTVINPTVSITATPNRVASGDATTVSWNATNVNSCTITRNGAAWKSLTADVSRNISGSTPDTITSQTTYKIECENDAGAGATVSATQIVNLLPVFNEF